MYTTTKSSLGDYDIFGVMDPEHQTGFEVIPEFGARINRLLLTRDQARGVDIISGFSTAQEISEDKVSKSAILFPFPNRIENGQYQVDGKKYQFPINERDKQNALHGLLTKAAFSVVKIETRDTEATIELMYTYDGSLEYYPFPFELRLTYHISDGRSLELMFDLHNKSDKKLPFGIGWHPYFQLPNWMNVKLQLGDFEHLKLNEKLIPTGEKRNDHGLHNYVSVDQLELDDCYKKISGDETLASLINSPLDLHIDVWGDARHFDYIQIYTPPLEDSIALEPMTCNVNAFNNGMGLQLLEPYATFRTTCGVKV